VHLKDLTMNHVKKFGKATRNFLAALQELYGDNKSLLAFARGFRDMNDDGIGECMRQFAEDMHPHAALLVNRDGALWSQPVSLFAEIGLVEIWADENLSAQSRQYIFVYVSKMYTAANAAHPSPIKEIKAPSVEGDDDVLDAPTPEAMVDQMFASPETFMKSQAQLMALMQQMPKEEFNKGMAHMKPVIKLMAQMGQRQRR